MSLVCNGEKELVRLAERDPFTGSLLPLPESFLALGFFDRLQNIFTTDLLSGT